MVNIEMPNRPIRLKNQTCPYCGVDFSSGVKTNVEHVVGRSFVPKGVLGEQWNLVLNSCVECNHEKSQLEDDISVITLMSGKSHSDAETSALVEREVARRAEKSGSRATGRSVAKSQASVDLALSPTEEASFNINFIGPPQIDDDRVFRLAEFHFRALCYFISYREDERKGYSPGQIRHVGRFLHSDWGNPRARWFMTLQEDWEHRFCGNLADGFFRASIKASPTSKVWALAVEWNHSVRVLALAGDDIALDSICSTIPELHGNFLKNADGNIIRIAKHVPLAESDDLMFQGPDT